MNWPRQQVFKIFLVLSILYLAWANELENVSDDDLLALLRNEKFVIVLFTKKNCPQCDEFEKLLVSMREDLVETFNPWVVKATNSNLAKLYKPSKEPAVIFFRHGVPLLYNGGVNEDELMHTFNENKEPVVKELTDDSFESLTQASSGATTGDWFIMFYSNECVTCQRLHATWEAVGAALKTRLNVARIDRKGLGRVTSRRFHVIEEPTFLFFRLGKMYHYNIPRNDVDSFVAFASDWYKNAKSEKVPLPKTPFDDLTQQIADYLRENPWVWKLAYVLLGIFLVLTAWKKYKGPGEPAKKVKGKADSTVKDKSKKAK